MKFLLQKLAWYTHGPIAIALINLLVVFIIILTIKEILPFTFNAADNKEEFHLISGGVLIILIGYGVVLECREHLLKIYGLYPKMHNEFQERIDEICGDYGVLYLVIGLLGEFIVQALVIPDSVIDTRGIENFIVILFCVVQLITVWLILRHSYKLLKLTFGVGSDT